MEYISPLGLAVLRYVIELGTFRAAAEQLKISQPAVSSHIHRLEEHLGVELFLRPYSRIVRPTDAGYLLYQYAVSVSASNKEVLKLLKHMTHGEFGQFSFALSVGRFVLLSSVISDYIKSFPNVNVIIRTCSNIQAQNLVLHGEADFGFCLNANNPQLSYLPFYREPMELFCAPSHPMAHKGVVTKEDLASFGLITGLEGSDYNQYIYNFFSSLGVKRVKNSVQAEDVSTILGVAEQGAGIGLLTRSAIENLLRDGKVVRLALWDGIRLPYFETQLVFRHRTKLGREVRCFLNFIYKKIAEQFPFITLLSGPSHPYFKKILI